MKEESMKIGSVNVSIVLAAFLSFFSGCVAVESPSDVVVVESERRGPPPWAPAHGWRRKHETYHYYPATQVYYYPTVRRYYWLEGREWRFGDLLPRRFILEKDKKIVLDLDYEPHNHHSRIVNAYPHDYHKKENRKSRGW